MQYAEVQLSERNQTGKYARDIYAVPQLSSVRVEYALKSSSVSLALRSGITVASEVHPRRGYC